jgi:hypothetical protein
MPEVATREILARILRRMPKRALESPKIFAIVGGALDGQQAASCPVGYRQASFFFHYRETLAFVVEGMIYDKASAVLFVRTRKIFPPRDPCPTMGPTERPLN